MWKFEVELKEFSTTVYIHETTTTNKIYTFSIIQLTVSLLISMITDNHSDFS